MFVETQRYFCKFNKEITYCLFAHHKCCKKYKTRPTTFTYVYIQGRINNELSKILSKKSTLISLAINEVTHCVILFKIHMNIKWKSMYIYVRCI